MSAPSTSIGLLMDVLPTAIARARRAVRLLHPRRRYDTGGRWRFELSPDTTESTGLAPDLDPGAPVAPTSGPPSGELLCPSFAPLRPGIGGVFGVIVGTVQAPEVVYLPEPVPVAAELFELTAPQHPSAVVRIAARCVERQCKNFDAGVCRLGAAVAREARRPVGGDEGAPLPPCSVREHCRWWAQEGPAACRGCSGVTTVTAATIRNARAPVDSRAGARPGSRADPRSGAGSQVKEVSHDT